MKKDIKKLAIKLREELRKDILDRYFHSEYYDYDIIESFYQDNQLSGLERSELDKLL